MLDSTDWQQVVYNLMRVGAAFALALPMAINRERETQIMGLRTFPLVSMGACAYILIGLAFIGPEHPDAKARVLQGLLSGLGFIGGGAILKNENGVRGTASAATIWVTGAIGVAVAFGVWELAVILAVTNWMVLRYMTPVKEMFHSDDSSDDSGSSGPAED